METDKQTNGQQNRIDIHIEGNRGWVRWSGRGVIKWLIAAATIALAVWELLQ